MNLTKAFSICMLASSLAALCACGGAAPATPDPEPEGRFSVGDGKAVVFSRGNLCVNADSKELRFLDSQYEVLDKGESDKWNDKFNAVEWFVDVDVNHVDDVSDMTADKVFLGRAKRVGNDAGNHAAGTWRTLSYDEMRHLLFKRKASTVMGVRDARFAMASVAGRWGLMLFPDQFEYPDSLPPLYGINDEVIEFAFDGDTNSFTAAQWGGLAVAGAVFLPTAADGQEALPVGIYCCLFDEEGAFRIDRNLFIDEESVSVSTSDQSLFMEQRFRLVREVD